MDTYKATMIAEGVNNPESPEEFIEAWQQLHDSGVAYQLQGWFGRTAKEMIKAGVIIDKR